MSLYKYGKKDPIESPFSPFKSYLDPSAATAPPPSYAHYGGRVTVPLQMDGNGPDSEVTIAPPGWEGCGDCTEAGKAHFLTVANYFTQGFTVPVPTANAVVKQYCASLGCTPDQLFNDPDTYDQGEDEVTTLTNWCQQKQYGVKLPFTAPVNDIHSVTDIAQCIYLCGGCYIGIQVQEAQQNQFPNEWEWVNGSPIDGGHCVYLCGYTGLNVKTDYVSLVTWGQIIRGSWNWLFNAIDEAHALVAPQAVAAGKSPTGLLIANWESDLNNLAA